MILCVSLAGCAPEIEPPGTSSGVVAQFDPTQVPPVLPLPNDFVLDPKTGLLAVPDLPGSSPAQLEFNAYLRTLDGFPNSTPVTATFSDAVDPASVTPSTAQSDGAIAVFDLTTQKPLLGDPMHSGAGDYDLQLGQDLKTLTIVPHLPLGGAPSTQPWKLGHRYGVIVFGGTDAHGVHGKDGTTPVIAAPTTFFLRSQHPLLTPCAPSDPNILKPQCLCPMTNGAFASSCNVATGLSLDQATQLEPLRQGTQAMLAGVLPAAGVSKKLENIVFVWTFTIAHGPFAVFDPTQSKVPFPNDVLIVPPGDPNGKVTLPAGAAPDSIRMYLNQLDGFSTTADASAPIDTADDNPMLAPVGTVAGQSVLLLNSDLARQPDYSVKPEMVNGGKDYDGLLLIHPNRALRPDKAEYSVVLTSDITDSKMRPLRPSPIMQFVKLESPLVDANGKTTLPGTLADADAKTLEGLRLAYRSAGLWDTLAAPPFSLPKDRIAMVWTFRTQSMTQSLRDLADYPGKKMLPTDVNILDVEDTKGALGPDVDRMVWGTLKSHVALGRDGTLDLANGTDVTLQFIMTTPKMVPPMGAPVAIVQHGLGQWRGDMRAVAEAFASQGWAAIAIDINYHGSRTVCTSDGDCDAGGKCDATGACSTKLKVACSSNSHCNMGGTCDTNTGICSNGLAPNSGLCMTHVEMVNNKPTPVTECRPAASGAAFLNFANPFAARDNFRQHVLDLSQLERVVSIDAPSGLKSMLAGLAKPISIDTTRTAYVGQSLGGIEGTLFLSVTSQPVTGVLNVPGGRLVDILVTSPTFMDLIKPLLAAMSITADTPAYYQLLNIFRWILDPGDPINFGRNIVNEPFGNNVSKKVIVQEAGKDTVIPNPWTQALMAEIGIPTDAMGHPQMVSQTGPMSGMSVSTFFPSAMHGFIFDGGSSTAAGQAQAVGWIASDGKLVLPPSK